MLWKKDVLFCDISPTTYAISEKKEILKRHIKNLTGKEKFCHEYRSDKLPNLLSSYNCGLIKTGKGIDIRLQENKAENIAIASASMNGMVIHPGETFSFWKAVGKTTKRRGYKDGRVIENNRLKPGIGGGLCNLANTIHLLILHSPMTVTEFHNHSDALAPDHGKRIPFGTGTSVSYNNVDYRFRNDTDQDVQLLLWCQDRKLYGELRSEREYPWRYDLVEEDHHFRKEGEKYYRVSRIYRRTIDRKNGDVLKK